MLPGVIGIAVTAVAAGVTGIALAFGTTAGSLAAEVSTRIARPAGDKASNTGRPGLEESSVEPSGIALACCEPLAVIPGSMGGVSTGIGRRLKSSSEGSDHLPHFPA